MNQDKVAFLPVKILNMEWAEKLLDGSVFMRSLFEFGPWNTKTEANDKAKEMSNAFRGDIHEGMTRNINPKTGDKYYNTFPPELRKLITSAWYFDDAFFKHLKIYSMYCLKYNPSSKEFERPDKRLKDFGDTAVIIFNPDQFLRRVLIKLAERFGDNINFKMGPISYFDIFNDFDDYNIFNKTQFYSWQNEIRIAIGILDSHRSIVNEKGQVLKPLIQDLSPLTLEIGKIRDIATAVPVEDLIALDLPAKIGLPLDN